MKEYRLHLDPNGRPSGAVPPSDTIYALVLSASTEKTVTVPEGAKLVKFASTGVFYARPDGTVAVPGSDITDGTAGEIKPEMWIVNDVTDIHLISSSGIKVTLSFYE